MRETDWKFEMLGGHGDKICEKHQKNILECKTKKKTFKNMKCQNLEWYDTFDTKDKINIILKLSF